VSDQRRSAEFYEKALGRAPALDAPGMTEFSIGENAVLGLMPEDGIVRLLGDKIVHPASAKEAPRAELYLVVDDAAAFHARAIAAGARELRPLTLRDWGDFAAYCADPDGHILAFASRHFI